jgi:hypothetical protein
MPARLLNFESITEMNSLASRSISPVELLHPNGQVRNFLILGSNCPPHLIPETGSRNYQPADLIILAPNSVECRIKGWLENAIQSINRSIAKDGVLYVLAPPLWRSKIKRLLRIEGFKLEANITHLPNWTQSRYLVPLKPPLTQYAFHNLMPTKRWKKEFIFVLLRNSIGLKLVENLYPWIGFAAHHLEDRPLLDWLYQIDGTQSQGCNAIIHAGLRSESGSITLLRFSNHSLPDFVMKLSWSRQSTIPLSDEVKLIPKLGPSAHTAGARIPEILPYNPFHDQKVSSQTALPGRLASVLLVESPRKIYQIMKCIITWLEAWHQITRTPQRLNQQWFEQEILHPATSLAPLLKDEKSYLDWLAERCEEINFQVPLFSAHNDLSMWNILLDEQGQIGLVDWNSARENCFPFVDLLYAMTDAVMIASGYKERLKAFQECFSWGGRYSAFIKKTLLDLKAKLEIPKDILDLSFHVCFIGHAANEQKSAESGDPLPFLEIVHFLAKNRNEVKEWIAS